MATKEDVLKELNWVTEKISSLVWTVNLSTLATTWSLLIGSASIPTQYRLQRGEAEPILLCSLLALICEMSQFVAAYVNNRQALHIIERDHVEDFRYNPKAWSYRLRLLFFYLKIILTFAAALILVIRLITKLGRGKWITRTMTRRSWVPIGRARD